MANIKVLHMGMDVNQNFDYEVGDDLALGLFNDLGPMVGSISMPITPAPSKSFITPSNLNLDVVVISELFKVHLIQNQKNLDPSPQGFSTLAFFCEQ
jgi:hypothetical protein